MGSPDVDALSSIAGAYRVNLRRFADGRGYFNETWRRSWIPGAREMVQGNVSSSKAGVLRGLHYHLKQADLWTVPVGRVRAVLWDLRRGSPTERSALALDIGEGAAEIALFIPRGVAHGFVATTDVLMSYLVDEYYDNSDELGVAWNDPEARVDWGIADPVLSGRDRDNPRLRDIPPERLPRYEP